jgi:hypothetical protein
VLTSPLTQRVCLEFIADNIFMQHCVNVCERSLYLSGSASVSIFLVFLSFFVEGWLLSCCHSTFPLFFVHARIDSHLIMKWGKNNG